MRNLAVISMSGGLDSATLTAEALSQGKDVFVVNYNYGQKNAVEQIAFKNLLNYFKNRNDFKGKIIGVKHLDSTPLFDEFLDVWIDMRNSGKMKEESHHTFYTPSRNLLFSVISAVVAEIIALNKDYDEFWVGLGIHKHSEAAYGKEHRDYWDITSEFALKLQKVFELNDVKRANLFAPFMNKTKADVVKRAVELQVPIELTWTCYNPSIKEEVAIPCLECEACIERELAGKEANIENINNYFINLNLEK